MGWRQLGGWERDWHGRCLPPRRRPAAVNGAVWQRSRPQGRCQPLHAAAGHSASRSAPCSAAPRCDTAFGRRPTTGGVGVIGPGLLPLSVPEPVMGAAPPGGTPGRPPLQCTTLYTLSRNFCLRDRPPPRTMWLSGTACHCRLFSHSDVVHSFSGENDTFLKVNVGTSCSGHLIINLSNRCSDTGALIHFYVESDSSASQVYIRPWCYAPVRGYTGHQVSGAFFISGCIQPGEGRRNVPKFCHKHFASAYDIAPSQTMSSVSSLYQLFITAPVRFLRDQQSPSQ